MTDELKRRSQAVVDQKRRQTYWKNRRLVDRMVKSPSPLQPSRMSIEQLQLCLEHLLRSLNQETADRSSPVLYALSRDALGCFAELMLRGTQLSLFPDQEEPTSTAS